MDMFIEFLSFTNDQVINSRKTEDLSLLDDTVLNALDINQNEKKQFQEEQNIQLSLNLISFFLLKIIALTMIT